MFKRHLDRKIAANSNEQSRQDASEVDITPMLDVVFIMLIFFVVTASFVREAGFGIHKPISTPQLQEPNPAPIVVEIDRNNDIRIQNISVSKNSIKATIVRLRAESPESAVIVRLHPKSNTASMVAAVDGIRSANIPLPSVNLIRG